MSDHLFSPISIGPLTLANRIIMGSMHTGLDHSDDPFGRLAAFYKERADGGVALIVTGGVSPNEYGLISPGSMKLTHPEQVSDYKIITDTVHQSGSKIILQILHAGRYAKQENLVAPSAIRSPISKFEPKEMSEQDILSTIEDFVNCASLAQQAGFDGIELLGSEGYCLNEFTALRTNHRTDRWGGSLENRARFPLEIIRAIRHKLGSQFFIQYRMSVLELVEGGWNIEEAQQFAKLLESTGVDLINTGIGWHEASIPTIAMQVPRAAFSWATGKIKQVVNIPVAAANRINTAEVADNIIKQGDADMVYLSRPFLADPDFVIKAQQNRNDEINTCIACNQSCLDNLFNFKTVSCLVNPRACHETLMPKLPTTSSPKNIAVIGAGAAGLSFAIEAKKLGHNITLYDAAADIGGQLAHARKVPGKEEFDELLRYFNVMLEKHQVTTQLNTHVTVEQLESANYDSIVLATGVIPRRLDIPGIDNSNVFSYEEAFRAPEKIGQTVVIIGAGGIGYDMAEFLTHQDDDKNPIDSFNAHWGIDPEGLQPGSLVSSIQPTMKSSREVTLLQRKAGKFGRSLGKTTSWIHQAELHKRGVKLLGDLRYLKIDDAGLHIEKDGETQLLAADSIIICAGQESRDELAEPLNNLATSVYRIGGVKEVRELDAAQAIRDGSKLAYKLSIQ
ncbi:MAG: NADPH-dependent 2,4-dienoyl-CoA reductase [Cycloclasticus sp. Phe_18]|nr:MAG: NADPH-dependent 2,4-dienoyl-CoA reductase [Cycloclasticus sp. Phe_18]MDF1688019.1 FAD-dependent oxidoreductase [Cycloclasticus sp.]